METRSAVVEAVVAAITVETGEETLAEEVLLIKTTSTLDLRVVASRFSPGTPKHQAVDTKFFTRESKSQSNAIWIQKEVGGH